MAAPANWWDAAPLATPLDIGIAQEGVSGPLADLARSVYQQESSGGRNTRTSNAGAVGGMQILPGTFQEVADQGWDINDPVLNARAGIRYLGRMLEAGGGDPRLAAIGYYGGPGAIQAAQRGQSRSDPRNPSAPNTMQYADQVLSRIVPSAQAGTLPEPAAAAQAGSDGNWWESVPLAEAQNQERSQQQPTAAQRIRSSAPARFLQGASDVVTGGAQMLVNALPESVVDAVNTGVQAVNDLPVIGDVAHAIGIRPASAQQLNQQIASDERAYQEARRATGQEGMDWWRLAGNVAGAAPLAAATGPAAGVTGAARIGTGAAQGALFGALQPVTEGTYAPSKLQQMALGGLSGGVAAGIGQGLSRLISPRASVNPQVQTLMREGVTPTPGQIIGGTARTIEDKAMSVPIVGDSIRSARTRGIQQLNTAALNRAVAPLGRTVTATGREGIKQVDDIISQAYDDLMPRLSFRPDSQFVRDLGQLQMMTRSMPPAQAQQFENIVRNDVASRLTRQGLGSGETFKKIESELGRRAMSYGSSANAGERELGSALRQLQELMRSTLERSNPQVAQELRQINQAYAMLTRLQRAAGGAGATDGVFTPAQLSSAVRAGDRSMRKGAFARGDALMQDLSDAAKGVMPGTVPDSGTAGRLLLSGGALYMSPGTAAGLAGASIPYLPGLNRLAAMTLASRPQFAPGVAQAVAQGFGPAPLIASPLANQIFNQK